MKISSQSIRWLGNNRVEISTTRSKTESGSYFRLGWFSISTPPSHRSSTVTEVVGMDRERFKVEKKRIKRGRFRDYNPERYYEYDEDAAYLREEQYQEIIDGIIDTSRTVAGYVQSLRKRWNDNNYTFKQILSDYDMNDYDDVTDGFLGLFAIIVCILGWLIAGWVGLIFGVIASVAISAAVNWVDKYGEPDATSITDNTEESTSKGVVQSVNTTNDCIIIIIVNRRGNSYHPTTIS